MLINTPPVDNTRLDHHNTHSTMEMKVAVFCLSVVLIAGHVSAQTRRNVLLVYGEYHVMRYIDSKHVISVDQRILARLRYTIGETDLSCLWSFEHRHFHSLYRCLHADNADDGVKCF